MPRLPKEILAVWLAAFAIAGATVWAGAEDDLAPEAAGKGGPTEAPAPESPKEAAT